MHVLKFELISSRKRYFVINLLPSLSCYLCVLIPGNNSLSYFYHYIANYILRQVS